MYVPIYICAQSCRFKSDIAAHTKQKKERELGEGRTQICHADLCAACSADPGSVESGTGNSLTGFMQDIMQFSSGLTPNLVWGKSSSEKRQSADIQFGPKSYRLATWNILAFLVSKYKLSGEMLLNRKMLLSGCCRQIEQITFYSFSWFD